MSSYSDLVYSTSKLSFLSSGAAANTVIFYNQNEETARIDANGVFRVTVEPTDENTKAFIKLVNQLLSNGIQLTKVEINGDQDPSL